MDEYIEKDDMMRFAMDKALFYLSFRAHSEKQMQQYLKKKGCEQIIIEETIEKLKEYGYIDDFKLAKRLVENGYNTRKVGIQISKQKLYQQGISNDIAQWMLSQIDPEKELENAILWIEKIQPKIQHDEILKQKQKLYRRLYSKGFSSDIINKALNSIQWDKF